MSYFLAPVRPTSRALLHDMRVDKISAPSVLAIDQRSLTDLRAVALTILGVSLIYGARLSREPLVGEETRWATAAREMLTTGDWVVPRQQGHVFPERPPMTCWLMAIGGSIRGGVDPIAIRLPSVIAVVLTSLLIYGYVRAFTAESTALIGALIYATSGQVLQIGRRGESEAVFALFVGASLLLWHLCYVRKLPPVIVWVVGFTFAALAALVKGPQAPVYFAAITVAYLFINRDARYLFRWQTVAGALVFLAIIAAWQIPFYKATDGSAVRATWAGLASDRIRLSGLLKHAISYPLETFVCLLPWSPMLLALLYRDVRDWLRERSQVSLFLLTAIVVAYPTVWMAAAARGRYFMPLYPIVAVLIASLIECCSQADAGSGARRAWNGFLLLCSISVCSFGVLVTVNSLLPSTSFIQLFQPTSFALLYGICAIAVAYVIWKAYSSALSRPSMPVIALTCLAGLCSGGLMVTVNSARWSDPTSAIAGFKEQLPPGTRLASLAEIEHRFAYYYGEPITQIPWPTTVNDVPADLDYFVFMRHWDDTADRHVSGRGRSYYVTTGTLPFEWEEISSFCSDRKIDTPTATSVVLGRVIRPLRAAVSDVSKPQVNIARLPTTAVK